MFSGYLIPKHLKYTMVDLLEKGCDEEETIPLFKTWYLYELKSTSKYLTLTAIYLPTTYLILK